MEPRLYIYLMNHSVTENGRREEDDCDLFLCMCVPDLTRSCIRLQQRASGFRRNSAQPCCMFILESG